MLQHLDIAIGFTVVMLILSLIITTIVHMVGVALELRGKNLIRSVSKLVQEIMPTLPQDEARKVANLVVNYKAVTNFSKKASWVGAALSRLWVAPTKAITSAEFIQLLESVANDTALHSDTRAKLAALFQDTVPSAAGALEQAPLLAQKLSQVLPTAKDQVDEAIKQVAGRVRKVEAETEKWFDTVMNRSSDWFATKTRIVTVIVAVVFAIALHIDTLTIVDQLSTNADTRARLQQSADELLKQSQDHITPTQVGQAALVTYRESGNAKEPELLKKVPAEYVTCTGIGRWLQNNRASGDTVSAFAKYCQDYAEEMLKKDREYFTTLTNRLQASDLVVIPNNLQTQHWLAGNGFFGALAHPFGDMLWAASQKPISPPRTRAQSQQAVQAQEGDPPAPPLEFSVAGRHVLGVLMTAVFLSMGAPFWFNALKQLSTLRPIIAGKADKAAQPSAEPETKKGKAAGAGE